MYAREKRIQSEKLLKNIFKKLRLLSPTFSKERRKKGYGRLSMMNEKDTKREEEWEL